MATVGDHGGSGGELLRADVAVERQQKVVGPGRHGAGWRRRQTGTKVGRSEAKRSEAKDRREAKRKRGGVSWRGVGCVSWYDKSCSVVFV